MKMSIENNLYALSYEVFRCELLGRVIEMIVAGGSHCTTTVFSAMPLSEPWAKRLHRLQAKRRKNWVVWLTRSDRLNV